MDPKSRCSRTTGQNQSVTLYAARRSSPSDVIPLGARHYDGPKKNDIRIYFSMPCLDDINIKCFLPQLCCHACHLAQTVCMPPTLNLLSHAPLCTRLPSPASTVPSQPCCLPNLNCPNCNATLIIGVHQAPTLIQLPHATTTKAIVARSKLHATYLMAY